MNTKVRLGKTKPYKCFVIDLEKDSVHNILLTGVTGSGKSTLCHSLLEQLIRQNSPEEVGFVIMDFKRVEYAEYKNSPYLLEPIIYDPDVGLKALEKLADLAKARYRGLKKGNRLIVVIIEECDIVYEDPVLFEKCWIELNLHKEMSRITILFSSSRNSREVFSDKVVNHSDLRLILSTKETPDYSLALFGSNMVRLRGRG